MSNESPPTSRERAGRGAFLTRHLLALIILGLAVVFILENTAKVRVQVIGPEVTAPLWAILTATLVAGMLILLLVQRRRKH